MHRLDSSPQGEDKNIQRHESRHHQEQMLVTDDLETNTKKKDLLSQGNEASRSVNSIILFSLSQFSFYFLSFIRFAISESAIPASG